MAHRSSRGAYYCFVLDQLPELRRRGLPVTRVADAIPYCSQAWALLTKEEKNIYTEKARKWNEKKRSQKTVKQPCNLSHPVPACLTTKMSSVTSPPDASAKENSKWKNDEGIVILKQLMWVDKSLPFVDILNAVVAEVFYFLNIYSHGKLPSHCEQRFLPCEIGCVKYSLQDGIMADFHHFIDPEVPPYGFRFHCQAASDATHKIPLSGFHLSRTSYAVVLKELLEFSQPNRDVQPHFYCRSNDRFRINWCLSRMASLTGIKSHMELLAVEDLLIELYWKKHQKEPSKTLLCRELDACLWDFCSNTRCKWHEENGIFCCALASCKKIAYCISKSLATAYGVTLTPAHLPPEDSEYGESTNTKVVILDAGRFQKMMHECSGYDRRFTSPSQDQECVPSNCGSPCGVKTSLSATSTMRGRGITRLLKSASDLSKSFSN